MKYIKLYEHHNTFYQKVDVDEFIKHKKTTFFDYSSITNLRKLIIDNKITDSEISIKIDKPGYHPVEKMVDFITYKISDDYLSPTINFLMFNTKEYGVDLHMLDDEWYKVSLLKFSRYGVSPSVQEFFLCDQWEGLIRLFKDKLIFSQNI